jgi:pimeloyl-ACP methyl ester carboxylesterase
VVIGGSVDPLVPSVNARILTRLLARAQSLVVSGGGHLCLLARARELCPLIASFLDEGDRAGISRTAADSG